MACIQTREVQTQARPNFLGQSDDEDDSKVESRSPYIGFRPAVTLRSKHSCEWLKHVQMSLRDQREWMRSLRGEAYSTAR